MDKTALRTMPDTVRTGKAVTAVADLMRDDDACLKASLLGVVPAWPGERVRG